MDTHVDRETREFSGIRPVYSNSAGDLEKGPGDLNLFCGLTNLSGGHRRRAVAEFGLSTPECEPATDEKENSEAEENQALCPLQVLCVLCGEPLYGRRALRAYVV